MATMMSTGMMTCQEQLDLLAQQQQQTKLHQVSCSNRGLSGQLLQSACLCQDVHAGSVAWQQAGYWQAGYWQACRLRFRASCLALHITDGQHMYGTAAATAAAGTAAVFLCLIPQLQAAEHVEPFACFPWRLIQFYGL